MADINMAALTNVSLTSSSLQQFTDFTLMEFIGGIRPLLVFVAGMTIYAVFVFKFYRFLSKRDIINLKTQQYYEAYEGFMHHAARILFYILENLVLIPLLIFFWASVLAALLALLSKNPDPGTILLSSFSIVAAVRITSYYNENLSQDLAKMIPFALLGVFLVDISYFTYDGAVAVAKNLPNFVKYLLFYLIFAVLLEFVLRITHGIASLFIKKEAAEAAE